MTLPSFTISNLAAGWKLSKILMKTFKILITQTKLYELQIEATSKANAEDIAVLAVSTDQGKVIDEYINTKEIK